MRKCESNRRTQTEHIIYCGREEQHHGPCSFADGNGMHFWFDGYEIANLRAMFDAMHNADYKDEKQRGLKVFTNGDWFEQVRSKLSRGFILPHNPPNRTAEQLLEDYERRLNYENK